jgi:hypothetical protein
MMILFTVEIGLDWIGSCDADRMVRIESEEGPGMGGKRLRVRDASFPQFFTIVFRSWLARTHKSKRPMAPLVYASYTAKSLLSV